MIKWIDITKKEPQSERLAIGYQGEMLVGYCSEENGDWTCESGSEVLEEVTHWMDLKELTKLKNSAEWDDFILSFWSKSKSTK